MPDDPEGRHADRLPRACGGCRSPEPARAPFLFAQRGCSGPYRSVPGEHPIEDPARIGPARLVLDVPATLEDRSESGAGGQPALDLVPAEGGNTVIAFVEDPDGYKVELIETGSRAL